MLCACASPNTAAPSKYIFCLGLGCAYPQEKFSVRKARMFNTAYIFVCMGTVLEKILAGCRKRSKRTEFKLSD